MEKGKHLEIQEYSADIYLITNWIPQLMLISIEGWHLSWVKFYENIDYDLCVSYIKTKESEGFLNEIHIIFPTQ